jgi:hypothetical protein
MQRVDVTTLEQLEVPQHLGTVVFEPRLESVKKLAYGVEDETGWLVGDPVDGLVHPVFLSSYLWWPQGFYIQEPGAIGHFQMFREKYEALLGYPSHLHAKTSATFFNPFRLGGKLVADVSITEKYVKRGKDFVVVQAMFTDGEGMPIARYDHTVMTRSHVELRPLS